MHNPKFKHQSAANCYYMYGMHTVLAAIANDKRKISHILCTGSVYKTHHKILDKYEYEIVDAKIIDNTLGRGHNHQGIAAQVGSIFSYNINDIDYSNPNCKVAILDQITDSYNIGAIIRSSAAFGIDAIILPEDNAPNENANIAKAACGALEIVKIIKVINLAGSIKHLKQNGFWIAGLDAKAENLTESAKSLFLGKIAVVLGSEDKGMRMLTKKNCDFLIKIPMESAVESLNVSNSAAIMFYTLYTR
jgi:23S rRNA (guanosine2251-2'-O)-methyltransferase